MREPIWQRCERMGIASRSRPWMLGGGELSHWPGWPSRPSSGRAIVLHAESASEANAYLDALEAGVRIVHGAITAAELRPDSVVAAFVTRRVTPSARAAVDALSTGLNAASGAATASQQTRAIPAHGKETFGFDSRRLHQNNREK